MQFHNYNWEVVNEEDGSNLFKFTVFVDMAKNLPKKIFNVDFCVALEIKRGHMRYSPDARYREYSRKLLDKLVKDKNFLNQVVGQIHARGKILLKESIKISKADATKMSATGIQEAINRWLSSYQVLTDWGIVLVFIDMGTELLTTESTASIGSCIKSKDLNPIEVFSILSSPLYKTWIYQEGENLLRLAEKASEEKNLVKLIADQDKTALNNRFQEFYRLLEDHINKYAWVYYAYEGPAMNIKDVCARLVEIIKKGNITEEIKKYDAYLPELEKRQQKLRSKINLDTRTSKLVKIAQKAMLLKAERKDFMIQSFYLIEGLLKEICRRGKINWHQLHHLLPWEVKHFLEGKVKPSVLNDRYDHCVYFSDGDLITGKEAEDFAKLLESKIYEEAEIKGQCACIGYIKGIVKIINVASDMGKMNKGDVLVSVATTPEVVPAMKKAAAIVTDVGGIACHAAIVSRELGVPCVIGTKIATKVLKDGQLVEVDANRGVVKIIK